MYSFSAPNKGGCQISGMCSNPCIFSHLMALVNFESNPFKRAPLEIFFLIAFWGQVSSLNFMFLFVCSIFLNSVQFKPIECDANATINDYPNGWWVKLIDQMEKKNYELSNAIFVHGWHQFWWKNLIPLIGYIYIKVMSKSRLWIFIGCEITQLDVISPWWMNETTIKEFHGIWNQNKFHVWNII